jgi:mevalonate kinase
MFRLFKRKKKADPILEKILKENEELGKILDERRKENAELEESIAETEAALKNLGYTDKDLERIAQKAKMKVIKKDED